MRVTFGAVVMLASIEFLSVSAHAASCPSGKVTCFDWCRRYASSSRNCVSGGKYSCDTKVGGKDACVADAPNRQITCEAWCKKYRRGSESCLRTHAQSCMKKYGSLKFMMTDRP